MSPTHRTTATLLCLLTLSQPIIAADNEPSAQDWARVEESISVLGTKAIPSLESLCKQHPQWTPGWLKLAELLYQDNRYDDTQAAARKALSADRTSAAALALALRALNADGRPRVAETLYAEYGQAVADEGGQSAYQAARSALLNKDLPLAKERIDLALSRMTAPDPDIYFGAGLIAHRLVQRQEAIDWYTKAVAKEPKFANAWHNLGLTRYDEGRTKGVINPEMMTKAVEALQKAKELLPEDPDVVLALGQAQIAAGQSDQAIITFEQARRLLPDNPIVNRQSGNAFIKLALRRSDPKKAAQDGSKALICLRNAMQSRPDPLLVDSAIAAALLADDTHALEGLLADDCSQVSDRHRGLAELRLARQSLDSDTAQASTRLLAAEERLNSASSATEDREERGKLLYQLGQTLQLRSEILTDSDPVQAKELLNRAAATLLDAGNLYHQASREAYFALQSSRSGPLAYEAAWQYLSWNNYISLAGWQQVVATYGSAKAWRNMLHIIIWAILALVCLFAGLRSLIFPQPEPEPTRRPRRKPAVDPTAAPPRPAAAGNKPKQQEGTLLPNTMNRSPAPLEPRAMGKRQAKPQVTRREADETLRPQALPKQQASQAPIQKTAQAPARKTAQAPARKVAKAPPQKRQGGDRS